MDSLNPSWLSIELDAIDADVEKWSDALRTSYEASVSELARAESAVAVQSSISTPNSCDP